MRRRLEALHRLTPVQVIAPQPWFPFWKSADTIHEPASGDAPSVTRPRMFYWPGLMKHRDADFYAASLRSALRGLRDASSAAVMDAHFEWPDGVGAWRVARESNLPFVCTLRGTLVSKSKNPSLRPQLAEMLREADALIAVSHALAALARRIAERDLEIHVIPNGIDPRVFFRSAVSSHDEDRSRPDASARWRLGRQEAGPCVVSVGHLQKIKGFHRLVEIWPHVCRRVGDAQLILVGGDAGERRYASRLVAMIASMNHHIAPGGHWTPIRLYGRRTDVEIAAILNAADLFALASDSEGCCNAIAESLACGCPVVATDVGGNRELVEGDELGLLAPLDDADALMNCIVSALSKHWDRREIARRGGRRTWDQVGRECADVLAGAGGFAFRIQHGDGASAQASSGSLCSERPIEVHSGLKARPAPVGSGCE